MKNVKVTTEESWVKEFDIEIGNNKNEAFAL